MPLIADCKNCGKQVILDGSGPDEKCYFCGEPALKKEVTMVQTSTEEVSNKEQPVPREVGLPPIPPKPKERKKLDAYWEENKEAILHDYRTMKLRDFFHRWMSVSTWIKYKKRWGVKGKQRGKPLSEMTPKEKVEMGIAAAAKGKGNHSKPEDTKVEKGYPALKLPEFPAFNSAWPMLTQIEWLKTYRELSRGELPNLKHPADIHDWLEKPERRTEIEALNG